MSLNIILFLIASIVVAANVEALVIGPGHAIYSPRQSILSSVHDADTVNIGYGGSGRRMSSLSGISSLGLGLGRRSYRPRLSSRLGRRNNIVVLGTGDLDLPSVEYGGGIGSIAGISSFGGLGGLGGLGSIGGIGRLGGLSGLGGIGGISRIGGYGGYGGDADHVTLPRGTNLRLAARSGLLEDADHISVI